MSYEPQFAHRFKWKVSFHLYAVQMEYRFNTEVEAQLKIEELQAAFKVLLGDAHNYHIKKFDLRIENTERLKPVPRGA